MMDDGSIRFERDRTKAEANWIKHGVSFGEAAEAFGDARGKIIEDPDHSIDEMRFVLIGMSLSAHLLVVCHCFRPEGNVIRIISARRATENEECQYRRQLS